jgi:transcriptional regulator with XRE-family HTH domain
MPIVKRKPVPPMPTATFAERVKAKMKAKGIRQSEIARQIGYTSTGVWNWLQGNTLPRAETLSALASILDVTEDWLRNGDAAEISVEPISESAPGAETMAEMIEALRAKIAVHAGYDLERVKLTLEFS